MGVPKLVVPETPYALPEGDQFPLPYSLANMVRLSDGRLAATGGGVDAAIQVQIFNADLSATTMSVPMTDPSTYPSHVDSRSRITALPTGGYAIGWVASDTTTTPTTDQLTGQVFAADGTPGAALSPGDNGRIIDLGLSTLADGSLLYYWHEAIAGGPLSNQRDVVTHLSTSGTVLGSAALSTTSSLSQPSGFYGAVGLNGGGIATAETLRQGNADGTWDLDLMVRVLDHNLVQQHQALAFDGELGQSDVISNAYDLKALSDGGFVLEYTDRIYNNATSVFDYEEHISFYNADGTRRGNDILLSSAPGYSLASPKLGVLSGGNVVAIWEDGKGGSHICGQMFDPQGDKIGQQFTMADAQTALTPAGVIGLDANRFVVNFIDTGPNEIPGTPVYAVYDGSTGSNISWRDATTAFDMSAVPFPAFESVVSAGAKSFTLVAADNTRLIVSGNGFSYVGSSNGMPTVGTIFTLDLRAGDGRQLVLLKNLWLSAPQFSTWLQTGDVQAFENAVVAGDDTISGNAQDDILIGGPGNDSISGLGGNDMLDGGTGADTMRGGAGDDSYVVDNASDQVIELAGQGTDLVTSSVGFTLGNNVENLTLVGTAAVNATGNALANTLTGNAAANKLDGKAGADTMRGGGGNDSYVVDNASDQVIELAGQGTDLVTSAVSFTLGDNVENLTLTGSLALSGTGNSLANAIVGNAGNNILDGKAGNDTLTGGAGNDTFAFSTALNRLTNVDTLVGFVSGADRIALSQSVFSALSLGTLAPAVFMQAAAATTSSQHILYNAATGVVSYDADGNGAGAAVAFAKLAPGQALAAGDFRVV